jgi:hypothetical protein
MSALEDALRGTAGVKAMRPLHVFKVSWSLAGSAEVVYFWGLTGLGQA